MTVDAPAHYAGILVATRPGGLDACARALAEKVGVTVSIRDPNHDRMIVVLEAADRDGLEELHGRLRSSPGVVTADTVVHYVDEDPEGPLPHTPCAPTVKERP